MLKLEIFEPSRVFLLSFILLVIGICVFLLVGIFKKDKSRIKKKVNMFYFEGNLGSDIVIHSVEEPNEFIQAGPDTEIEVAIYKGPNIKCKKGDVLWFGVDYIKK